jgi:Rad3-related DNA helicase
MHPIISQYIATNKTIPYLEDLTTVADLNEKEKAQLIEQAVHELATSDKTKGTQLFLRFYENDKELFQLFRTLNSSKKNTQTAEFQEVGEQVVGKLRYLEQILTDKMMKRDTDRTIVAFYDHVRLFFPYFDLIGIE